MHNFKVGDQVEAGKRGTDQFDVGTIIRIVGDVFYVAWERADAVYTEGVGTIEHVPAADLKPRAWQTLGWIIRDRKGAV